MANIGIEMGFVTSKSLFPVHPDDGSPTNAATPVRKGDTVSWTLRNDPQGFTVTFPISPFVGGGKAVVLPGQAPRAIIGGIFPYNVRLDDGRDFPNGGTLDIGPRE